MNKLRYHLLAFVALSSAIVLSAHPTNGHTHKGLRFDSVETTMTFADGTIAAWSVDKNKNDSYTLTITQPGPVGPGTKDEDCAMSLLTLGIQNLAADGRLTLTSGTISIKPTTKAGVQWTALKPGDKINLPAVGMAAGTIVTEDVGLIRVEGTTCTIAVVSKRIRKGNTPWKMLMDILSNHDTTPPPPYGGGEN